MLWVVSGSHAGTTPDEEYASSSPVVANVHSRSSSQQALTESAKITRKGGRKPSRMDEAIVQAVSLGWAV
jgi:hypothetical protein